MPHREVDRVRDEAQPVRLGVERQGGGRISGRDGHDGAQDDLDEGPAAVGVRLQGAGRGIRVDSTTTPAWVATCR